MKPYHRVVIVWTACVLSLAANGWLLSSLLRRPSGSAITSNERDTRATPASAHSISARSATRAFVSAETETALPGAPESVVVPYELIQSWRDRSFDRITPDGIQLSAMLMDSLALTESEKSHLDQAAKTMLRKLQREDSKRAQLIDGPDGSAYFLIQPDVPGTAATVNALWDSLTRIAGKERGVFLQGLLSDDPFLVIESKPIEVAIEQDGDNVYYVESGGLRLGVHAHPLETTRYGHLFNSDAWEDFRKAIVERFKSERQEAADAHDGLNDFDPGLSPTNGLPFQNEQSSTFDESISLFSN